MANITSSFTYLLPTEDYVSGVSTNRSGSYTYTGPENFSVQINELSGKVEKINVTVAPEGSLLKTINATDAAQLPMAYALSHQLIVIIHMITHMKMRLNLMGMSTANQ